MAKGPDVIEKPKAHLPAGSFSAIRLGAGAINEPGKTDGTGNDAPNNTEREVEQKSNDTAYAGNGHLIPVAAFRSAPARAARQSGLRTMNFDGISVHSHSAAVSYDSQLLNLAEGEAMIVADKPAVVRLTNGAVAQLASGTIAMVNQKGERAFIQVLHDTVRARW